MVKSLPFSIGNIDHVEMFVPDRHVAAKWYQQKLGFQILEAPGSDWGKPKGPVMISPDGGTSKLALFEKANTQDVNHEKVVGFYRVAFRLTGENFINFINSLSNLNLTSIENDPLSANDIIDYGILYSIYCLDPWGHKLEFASYDHDYIKQNLRDSE